MLAVAERQSLETLSRDEKTSSRALAQLKDKIEQLTSKRTKLAEDEDAAKTRRTEVGIHYRDGICARWLTSSLA